VKNVPGFVLRTLLWVLLGCPFLSWAQGEEQQPPEKRDSIFLISPLIGPIHNEIQVQGPPGTPAQAVTDTGTEYGLYLMVANPRVVINNTLFHTEVNNTLVWGNISTLNFYGPAEDSITWYLGASYLWHTIDGDVAEVTITEPLAKLGVLFRIPEWHLSINPYVGMGWQTVDSTVTTPHGTSEYTEHTTSILYGVTSYWRWRMFYANIKYYIDDNQDRDEQYNVLRVWGTAMLSDSIGILTRCEYAEQSGSTDTSALVGPVFIF
jgi:hypothetical protein